MKGNVIVRLAFITANYKLGNSVCSLKVVFFIVIKIISSIIMKTQQESLYISLKYENLRGLFEDL
jgi:hypothetical protein